MLENGMLIGTEADLEEASTAADNIDLEADEVIADAIDVLATHEGLAAAITEAQADGRIDGAMLAAILMPTVDDARWKALLQMAEDLIVAASIGLIYAAPGVPFARYADLDRGAIEANIRAQQREALAQRLACQFGQCEALS